MDYTILVNKEHRLDEDYIPSNLVITDNNENNFHDFLDPTLKPMIDKIERVKLKYGLAER